MRTFISIGLFVVQFFLNAMVMADEFAGATVCNACSDYEKQHAALKIAPVYNGVSYAYVLDHYSRGIEKYELFVNNEPGLSINQATRVETEPEIKKLVNDYWSGIDSIQSGGEIEIPDSVSPGLPEFIGNFQDRSRTINFVQNQSLKDIFVFGNLGPIMTVILRKFAGFDGSGLLVTLRFSDGGVIKVRVKLDIDSSTQTVAIVGHDAVEGSAILNGVFFPIAPGGFESMFVEGNQFQQGIEGLFQLARMFGIPITCEVTTSTARIHCDAQGACRVEVIGVCR